MVALAVDPAGKADLAADVAGAELAAGMRAIGVHRETVEKERESGARKAHGITAPVKTKGTAAGRQGPPKASLDRVPVGA
ncbi:hypothetical protein STHU_19260 [Allostella humosa]|nr:hypothetical protein STHU_19260 [Stella humosa]